MNQRPVLERFCERAQVSPSGCWWWMGHHNNNGYGMFSIQGRMVLAHRFAYETFIGSIPVDMELDHLCQHRGCVNPWHLEVVTHRENLRRGQGWGLGGKLQRAKTHCPHGHPYDEVNTYVRQGYRECRACHRERETRRRSEKCQEVLA